MRIFAFLVILVFICGMDASFSNDNDIIDSDMTFEKAIEGTKAPKEVLDSMVLLNVRYYSFDNKIHRGQIIIHKSVEEDVVKIFELILKNKFPVGKVIPIVKYNWSDNASMSDNNSSAFCYRFIAGTEKLSLHSYGKAIDINPFYNPYIDSDGSITPKGAKYNPEKKGTFSDDNPIVKEFIKLGWRWGGNFNSYKDYHHFDKK